MYGIARTKIENPSSPSTNPVTAAAQEEIGAIMQIGAAMFGMIYASATVLNPLVVIDAFGIREYTKIQARISLINGVINAAMQSLWGFIADLNGGDFTMSMFICVAFCIIGCISAIIGIKKGKKLERI